MYMEKLINENLDLLIFIKRMELTHNGRDTLNNRIELDFSLLGKVRKYGTQLVDITSENSYF